MSRLRGLLVAILAVLCLQALLARPAQAWWDGNWPYRMKIDADLGPNAGNVTQPVGRVQMLVRLFAANFNFSSVKDDGSDLRFVGSDDKTPLHFYIARWDPLVDQVALIWVDVPDLAPGAVTPFYLYWGNKNAPAGGDPHATFDPDQLLVYDFTQQNGLPKDVTANGLNALTGGKRVDSGITGFGLRLDGSNPVHLPQSPLLNIEAAQAGTWSLWFNMENPDATATLFDTRDATNAFTIGVDHGVVYAETGPIGQTQRSSPGKPISGNAWHLVDVTADGTKLDVYVDGSPSGELAAALPAIAGTTFLGGSSAPPAMPTSPAPDQGAASPTGAGSSTGPGPGVGPGTGPATAAQGALAAGGDASGAAPAPAAQSASANFVGVLDEFKIAKVARPIGAFRLAFENQGPASKILGYEKPEESSIFGTGYIGIILKSVTPDAWVVIGILMVMMVISWLVMVAKAIYLNGLGRANRVFRLEFERNLDHDDTGYLAQVSDKKRPALRRSSLFQIYDVAAAELRARFARGRLVPGEPVPPQSLTAIRSALDAVYVREARRLNGMMVLLTIAIAGGPFIGLLGTVIGVMITFAAIAAAGDVNVNAIAPGISAALLATVAGLAVAIPALFGYNYFTIRIRDASQEMLVFIEELIARIGEGASPRRAGLVAERAAHGAVSPQVQPAPGE
jgi:biopolymer transport protein ExbB